MEYVCPILGRATQVFETPYSREPWKVMRCVETGFVFLANPPDYSLLESELAWERTYVEERKRRRAEEPIASFFSSLFKRIKWTFFPKRNKMATIACWAANHIQSKAPLSLLDVGCGWGDLLLEIHQRFLPTGRSLELIGIEISKQLAIESESKVKPLGGRILFCNALDGVAQLSRESLSMVTMCSFLEHEAQPLQLLKKLYPVLRHDGMIVLKVPNFACWNRRVRGKKWCGFRYPDHVNYFTPNTLAILAHQAGYRILRQKFFDKSPFNDSMYAVLVKVETLSHAMAA